MHRDAATLAIHDLKNALGALEGELHLLSHAATPGVALAHSAWQRCRGLRHDLLAFLTVHGNDGPLIAKIDDASPTELTAEAAAAACSDRVELRVQAGDAASAPPWWFFDRHLVRLALDAAVHNACRFATSSVCVDARAEGDWLVFSVDDDGPGLDAAAHPGPFSSGLGTELCRRVAAAHHGRRSVGRIELFTLPGGGTRFELWLP